MAMEIILLVVAVFTGETFVKMEIRNYSDFASAKDGSCESYIGSAHFKKTLHIGKIKNAHVRATCIGGPGHFLGSDQTLRLMQSEYIYPTVGNRNSPKEWREKGQPMLIDTAKRKLAEILATHHPHHISREMDDAIRTGYPVRLARSHMGQSE